MEWANVLNIHKRIKYPLLYLQISSSQSWSPPHLTIIPDPAFFRIENGNGIIRIQNAHCTTAIPFCQMLSLKMQGFHVSKKLNFKNLPWEQIWRCWKKPSVFWYFISYKSEKIFCHKVDTKGHSVSFFKKDTFDNF